MNRPCLDAAGLGDRRTNELTPVENIMAKVAWLGDNYHYSNNTQAKTICIEIINDLKALKVQV